MRCSGLGEEGLEFGPEKMLGMDPSQEGHLGLQELAADGERLGGAFPAFVKAQSHGSNGLREIGGALIGKR